MLARPKHIHHKYENLPTGTKPELDLKSALINSTLYLGRNRPEFIILKKPYTVQYHVFTVYGVFVPGLTME
jgi:hypothetical protein